MPRSLNQQEIEHINDVLVGLCERFEMEFAVACMQTAGGPLELFRVQSGHKYTTTTKGIADVIKQYAALHRADEQN